MLRRVYRVLKEEHLEPRRLERLEAEFLVDDHSFWDLPEDSPKTPIVRQTQWSNNREKVQTEMETMGNQQDEESKSMLEQVQVENRERYDYRQISAALFGAAGGDAGRSGFLRLRFFIPTAFRFTATCRLSSRWNPKK